jgi:DNA-binding response OmpR family regulator
MARTILVVDDEATLRETVVDALEAEGFRVLAAADGREALTRFRAERPDLVLLDLMLPELSGIEVCRIIRAESGVPIVMLTAKDSELDKVVGLELGADDYVTKPFSPKELRARIRAALRRGATPTQISEVYRFGDIEVDAARCEVRRGGAVVETTATEFKLLAAFIRNRGRVLSREKLLDQAWGEGTFLTDRVVDNHIVALRRKIEPDPAEPKYLVSVRGVGYRFDG